MLVWPTMSAFTAATGPINCSITAIPRVSQFIDNINRTIDLCIYFSLFTFSSAVVGFKCPTKVDPNSVAARFWPFPRFPVAGDCHRLITCVEGHPRLISCGEDKVFDEHTLTCEDPEYASGGCANYGK